MKTDGENRPSCMKTDGENRPMRGDRGSPRRRASRWHLQHGSIAHAVTSAINVACMPIRKLLHVATHVVMHVGFMSVHMFHTRPYTVHTPHNCCVAHLTWSGCSCACHRACRYVWYVRRYACRYSCRCARRMHVIDLGPVHI